MAITAKFVADFSSFESAVKQANTKLDDLSKGATVTGGQLSRMADQFTGARLISEATKAAGFVEALGGTSKLTGAELQKVGQLASDAAAKLTALGRDVPPGIQKIADAAKEAGKSFEEAFPKLDLKGAIENPMAAAEKGIEAFGEALGPAGIAAAGFAIGALAIGAALGELTLQATEAGAKLNDVSEVTGIAVPQLSRLSNASTVAGTDLQTMSNAIFMMQKNLGENPDKFQKGLERLNINFEDFQAIAPDQQFLAIAESLKATEDPVQRNAAGFELMGRQFRDLAPSLLKINEALAETADIKPFTDEEAKAAEAFEMHLTSIKVHAEALGLTIGRALIEPLSALVDVFASVGGAVANFAGGLGGILSPIGVAKELFGFAAAALDVFRGTANDAGKAIDSLTLKQQALDRVFDAARTPDALVKKWKDSLVDLTPKIANVNAALALEKEVIADLDPVTKQHIDAMNKAAEAQQKFRDSVKGFSFGTFIADTSKLNAIIPDLSGHMEEQAAKFAEAHDQLDDLESTSIAYNSAVLETETGVRKLYTAFSTLPNVVAQSTKQIEAAGNQISVSFGARATSSLNDISKILTHLPGAFGAITSEVARTGEAIIKNLSNGNVWGAAIAGITGVAGAFAKLFSDPEKEINPIREAFVQAAGGLDALNQHAAAGVTLNALLNAKNADQYKAAIDALNAAFATNAANVSSAVNGILTAAQTVGGNFPTALEPALTQLLTMKGLTDDEKNALLGLSGSGTPSFDQLTTAAGHYGLKLDDLGGKVSQLSISHEADQIATDYNELVTTAGADSDKVLAGMKGGLNDLVNHALSAGATLPTALQPLIHQLDITGQLTDDAGNKITDLSKLKFDDSGDPLAKGMEALTNAINHLGDLLSPSGLPATAAAAAASIGNALGGIKAPDLSIHVGFQVDTPPDFGPSYAAMGGYVGANGVQYLAGGGNVLRFMPRGSDTVPAMLTEGEGVVNRRGMKSLGKAGLAALNSGSSAGGADMSGVEDRLDAMAQQQADHQRLLPKLLRDAVLLSSRVA